MTALADSVAQAQRLAESGQLEAAADLLQSVLKANEGSPRAFVLLGRIQMSLGRAPEAEASYRQALALEPTAADARLDLGNLLLRADRIKEAAGCFEAVLQDNPKAVAALEGLGFVRQRQGRLAEAAEALDAALALEPNNLAVLANLGGLRLDQGEAEQAVTHLSRVAEAAPQRLDLRVNLAAALFAAGRQTEALLCLDQVLAKESQHTRAMGLKVAYLETLGRHEEVDRLFDPGRMIQVMRAESVPGFETLRDFNQALIQQVEADPTLVADRAGKSTRGGSQTGELFGRPTGALAQLQDMVRQAVRGYFKARPAGGSSAGPVRPKRMRLTAWATVLRAEAGYQESHNHPSGRLSGVYYVQVPAAIGAAPGDTQGFIEFGRPHAKLGATEDSRCHLIQPEEGLMLLFPSHAWHRTLPFHSDKERISIAFDLIPEG